MREALKELRCWWFGHRMRFETPTHSGICRWCGAHDCWPQPGVNGQYYGGHSDVRDIEELRALLVADHQEAVAELKRNGEWYGD